MQIDLFSDSMMTRTNNRSVKQIEKRSFSLDVTLATIETKFKELLPEEEFALFRRSVYESINVKREYTGIGTNFCDNKLYLEYLGIGKYAKDYTVIVDLSNCLDYILHRLTGCDPNKIRNIENYDLVSYSLLNLKTELCPDLTYSIFCNIDPLLDNYIIDLYNSIANKDDMQRTESEVLHDFIYAFYLNIFNEVNDIKTYIMAELKKHNNGLVYRSKGFSSMVSSCDYPINEELILHQNGYCDYKTNVKSYSIFEYLDEVRRLYESFR